MVKLTVNESFIVSASKSRPATRVLWECHEGLAGKSDEGVVGMSRGPREKSRKNRVKSGVFSREKFGGFKKILYICIVIIKP